MALEEGGPQVCAGPETPAEICKTCLCVGNEYRVGLCSRERITSTSARIITLRYVCHPVAVTADVAEAYEALDLDVHR